jgi:acetylglutamate kinase
VYCFDKNGVLRDEKDEKSIIRTITKEDFAQYKEDGVISGGMIPKLENAFNALAAGVKEVILMKADNLNKGEGTFII